jgi:predicted alpha/beta-hydrolase family hydrolase
VVLVGKSMGGRIGCHLALQVPVTAVVCLGYPLSSPGKNASLRDQVLLEARTPTLFLQGTRDRLCPLDALDRVRARMAAPNAVHVVESGDHSLMATKAWLRTAGMSQDDVDTRAAAAIAEFFARHLG